MEGQVNGAEARGARIVGPTAGVDQAAGMLSVQLEVPVEAALVWMRTYAFVHGQFVAEFAADVVTRKLRFDVGDRRVR